ncbi:hypothetical protein V1525DRAFT_424826 [Lipomyces kononenkoae]|uniref:Uncharacterized protein n=1 Tax=Lipomyces kononenkoae TaxID=34357 RepID=A0ACC3T6G7_LIPKO
MRSATEKWQIWTTPSSGRVAPPYIQRTPGQEEKASKSNVKENLLDVEKEVQKRWDEYQRVQRVLDDEGSDYPKLWYDGDRNVAIVEGPPSPLSCGNGWWLVARMGRCDLDGRRDFLMITVEVGISRPYERVRFAISWSVCALPCPLGIAMQIREGRRNHAPRLYYSSLVEENAAVAEAEEDFRHQLTEHRYGPLVRGGVTWFGRIRQVILETYRVPNEDLAPGTLLDPSKSFESDELFVGDDVPQNLQEIVVGDCIPDHILNGEAIGATPVNFFSRDWFEGRFQNGMVTKAGNRMRPGPE